MNYLLLKVPKIVILFYVAMQDDLCDLKFDLYLLKLKHPNPKIKEKN